MNFVYEPNAVFLQLMKEKLSSLQIPYISIDPDGKVKLAHSVSQETLKDLEVSLATYNVQLVKNEKQLTAQIKVFLQYIVEKNYAHGEKISTLLTEKFGYSYPYLSNRFSNDTFTTIQKFYIFLKIEKVKHLLLFSNKSIKDIVYELQYSSVSHLSKQFKNTTGLTISEYLHYISNRKKREYKLWGI